MPDYDIICAVRCGSKPATVLVAYVVGYAERVGWCGLLPDAGRGLITFRERCTGASRLASTEISEELYAFLQAPFHHLPTHQHFADDFPDLGWSEIKTLVELRNANVDLFARQVRIADSGSLGARRIDEGDDLAFIQPSVLDRLLMKDGTRIGRSE